MNIRIENTNVAAGKVFRLIWRGCFVGTIAVFVPLFSVIGLREVSQFEMTIKDFLLILVAIISLGAPMIALEVGALTLLGLILWPGRKTQGDA